MKKLLLALGLLLLPSIAWAQCNGVFPPNNICGSTTGGSPSAIPSTSFPVTLPPLASGKIWIGSAGNVPTAQTPSGDCTLSVGGVLICTKTNGTSFGPLATQTIPATVPQGGTGQTSFTTNLPLIGNSAGALAQGTRSGNTTSFGTTSGTLTSGHCSQFDANGNIVDSGAGCSGTPTFTAPGTGGQTVTMQSILQRTLWANDYGMLCNGSDDSTALQNAVNEAITLQSSLRLYGNCTVNSNITASSATNFLGFDFSGISRTMTTLTFGTSAGFIIDMPFSAVQLHDIQFATSGTTNTGITMEAPSGDDNISSSFYNLQISGFGTAMNFTYGQNFYVHDNFINGFTTNGIQIEDTNNPDAGAGNIHNNTINGASGSTDCILYNNNGSLRVTANALNVCTVGINLSVTGSTSDLIVANNNVEGVRIGVSMSRTSSFVFNNVMISSNEFLITTNGGNCVVASEGSSTFLTGLTITGNVCVLNGTSQIGWLLTFVQGFIISNNVTRSASSSNIQTETGSSTSNGVVGPNTTSGSIGSSSVAGTSVFTPASATSWPF